MVKCGNFTEQIIFKLDYTEKFHDAKTENLQLHTEFEMKNFLALSAIEITQSSNSLCCRKFPEPIEI